MVHPRNGRGNEVLTLKQAIDWLTSVFEFRELMRMARPDGSMITPKLECSDGGLVMVAAASPDFVERKRERVPNLCEQKERSRSNLTQTITVMVSDVDSPSPACRTGGRHGVGGMTTDHTWGLRTYLEVSLGSRSAPFCQVELPLAEAARLLYFGHRSG